MKILAITTLAAALLLGGTAGAQYIDLRTLPPMPTTTSDNPNAVIVGPDGHAYPRPNWIVLIPPLDTGNEVLASAPLSRWIQADIYLDEASCNRALPNFAGNYLFRFANQSAELDMDQFAAVQQQTQHAVCIWKNDPRLR